MSTTIETGLIAVHVPPRFSFVRSRDFPLIPLVILGVIAFLIWRLEKLWRRVLTSSPSKELVRDDEIRLEPTSSEDGPRSSQNSLHFSIARRMSRCWFRSSTG